MKKFTYYFFAFALAAFLFTSCSKTGAVGPTGATGATGAVGPAGPAGADGKNGSVIYSGTADPSATVGAVGDFYINLTTGLLFGPKTDGGWGTGVSLKGATGATGAAGSKIYSGSGAPPSTTGVNGDYFLDSTDYLLYGPKTSSGWGTPISLQGPAGPAGPQGPAGNANVKTDVFTLGNADWLWNSQYLFETGAGSYTEYFTRYSVRNNSNVTQDILDNGLVLIYFQPSPVNNPNQWAPVPYQFDSSFGYTYNFVAVTAVGSVTMHFFFIQTSTTATLPQLSTFNMISRKFKIVTIAGQAASLMKANHIDIKNYNAVSKVTGLWQQDKN